MASTVYRIRQSQVDKIGNALRNYEVGPIRDDGYYMSLWVLDDTSVLSTILRCIRHHEPFFGIKVFGVSSASFPATLHCLKIGFRSCACKSEAMCFCKEFTVPREAVGEQVKELMYRMLFNLFMSSLCARVEEEF